MDSLDVIQNQILKNLGNDFNNVWLWISIIEFIIIGFLLMPRLNAIFKRKKKDRDEVISQKVDFDNIIDSSFNSKGLYDELKRKCHPDLFPNNKEKRILAEKIFMEISENKHNLKKLGELKDKAVKKLNIKI